MDLILGVDGGGSKTVVMLTDRGGQILSRGNSGASNYQVMGREAAQSSLVSAIKDAFVQANLPLQPVRFMCLGMAGVGRKEDSDWLLAFCRSQNLALEIEIVTDAELLLWAGTPQGWGVGCISGTGSIAFGIDVNGRKARAGGWGYLMGDEGSGYAIGLAVLRAVTQAADSRAPQTSMSVRLLKELGLEQVVDLIPLVYRSGISREEIAQLTKIMAGEAAAGDQAAQRIENEAASSLSDAICTVARQLDFSGEVPCALGGGVLTHCASIARKVIDHVRYAGVKISPVAIVHEPVRGAINQAMIKIAQRA